MTIHSPDKRSRRPSSLTFDEDPTSSIERRAVLVADIDDESPPDHIEAHKAVLVADMDDLGDTRVDAPTHSRNVSANTCAIGRD